MQTDGNRSCDRLCKWLIRQWRRHNRGAGDGAVFGEEEHKAHATAIAVILPLSLLSLGVYLWKADLGAVWRIALWASAGGLVGGFVGAKLLQRVSGVWLHRIFRAFMLAAAVRLIL